MIDWTQLVATLGSTAIVVGIFGWIGRSLAVTWLANRLEGHKDALRRATDSKLEELKYELRIEESRRSRVLLVQAKIVSSVYARLERLHEAVMRLAAPINHEGGNVNELRRAAVDAFNDFSKYWFERGIWLDVETCTTINDLQSRIGKLLFDLNWNIDANGLPANRKKWSETYSAIGQEIPVARQQLDSEFRKILGVAKGDGTQ